MVRNVIIGSPLAPGLSPARLPRDFPVGANAARRKGGLPATPFRLDFFDMRIKRLLLCALVLGVQYIPAIAVAGSPQAGASESAAGGSWLTSVEAAFAAAEDGDRFVLVDLYAEWCGWCKVLEREVFTSSEFRDFTRDMVLLRVDVDDGGEGSELQARYQATSLPTTLILDAGMAKVGEVKGYAPTAKFITAVRRELEEFEAMLEFFDQVRRGGDVELMRRLAEDFHDRGDGTRAAALYQAMLEHTPRGGAEAWLHYQSADAYRLAGRYGRAESSLMRASEIAGSVDDPSLQERLDMLRFYIAHDSGDCGAAVASLEQFLDSHPRSGFTPQARRALAAIRRGEEMKCT